VPADVVIDRIIVPQHQDFRPRFARNRFGRVRQRITLQQGIPQETAKRLVAEIKAKKLKVQAAIQGDTVRVSGKNRDDLQLVIATLKALDLDVPLSFTNYRST